MCTLNQQLRCLIITSAQAHIIDNIIRDGTSLPRAYFYGHIASTISLSDMFYSTLSQHEYHHPRQHSPATPRDFTIVTTYDFFNPILVFAIRSSALSSSSARRRGHQRAKIPPYSVVYWRFYFPSVGPFFYPPLWDPFLLYLAPSSALHLGSSAANFEFLHELTCV